MKKTLLFLLMSLMASPLIAADFAWHGRYRFEGLSLGNPDFTSGKKEKSYLLHHLVLEPRIIAADGLNIYGRFDLLNNSLYTGSQVGQFMGNGPRGTKAKSATTTEGDSNSLSRNQAPESLQVTELYLVWLQEYSSFMAGRMSPHFGLGISHDSGKGEFDHWMSTKDLVGFKMLFGNLSITPYYGKVSEGSLTQEDDINEYIFHVQYDNPESETTVGLFYEIRNSGKYGNDAPTTVTAGNEVFAGALSEGWDGRRINLFLHRGFDRFSAGLEASFLDGNTGVKTAANQDINMTAHALVAEFGYHPEASKWGFGLKTGLVSGDDPSTAEKYEGYLVNRNYNVANILFNHSVGQLDVYRTGLGEKASDGADHEYLSNAVYVAPQLDWKFSDNWNLGTTFIWANTVSKTLAAQDTDKSLGYEVDFNLDYKPNAHLAWRFESGFLFPGDAFKGGTNEYSTGTAVLLGTKAAISF